VIRCSVCQDKKERDPRILNDVCEDCIKEATARDITLAELKSIYLLDSPGERRKRGRRSV